MRYFLTTIYVTLLLAMLLPSCASDDLSGEPVQGPDYSRLVLSLTLPGSGADGSMTRGDFDNFDNEDDKWGKEGENMEQLRVIVLDGNGNVEVNAFYADLTDATRAGKYEYRVLNHDTKTVIFLANEDGYVIETDEGPVSASAYFNAFVVNSRMSVDVLQRMRLKLADNADKSDKNGATLRKPLPISAIYTEYISTSDENEVVEREYDLHRAAVKYSFRIINKSEFDHKLNGISISRVADEEFLFPNAIYETNSLGHKVIKDYFTPATAKESEYYYGDFSIWLPKRMTQAVQVIDPIYVPEGLAGTVPHQVSITLNSAPLAIWGELKWRMPGQSEATGTPMTDLPRNSHVVVNITIKDDNTFEFIADVQPYSSVKLDPLYGLERDKDGNVIVQRYPDGTFEVVDNGEIVHKDEDGDEVLKKFKDGSIYCREVVLKDYIHDSNEIDYIYYFEKDRPGGNMIIIREKSTGGTYHDQDLPDHDHETDDRALYVLDKAGDFLYVTYDEHDNPTYSRYDMHGDLIIQVNGYQFRNEDDMHKYIGSYVVQLADGTEELRFYKDGTRLDWETGVAATRSTAGVSPARRQRILARMRDAKLWRFGLYNK